MAAAGLTARAIVGLVGGIDHPLDRAAADRAGLAEAAVDRHPLPKRSHPLGKGVAGLAAQPLDPLRQDLHRGAVQPRQLLIREGGGEAERGHPLGWA